MGCGSGNPEGKGTCLGGDDPGDIAKFAADLFNERLARRRIRLIAFSALGQEGFDADRSCADHPLGPTIEKELPSFARLIPTFGDRLVLRKIGSGAAAERFDQSERMANARQPRDGLGIRQSRIFGRRLDNEMKHLPAVTGAGL